MKTSELTGAALDWAVAKCEGMLGHYVQPNEKRETTRWEVVPSTRRYSTDWAQGGPIIEREQIGLTYSDLIPCWYATSQQGKRFLRLGETPLIAAMRCYVASKLGDDVDVPSELHPR